MAPPETGPEPPADFATRGFVLEDIAAGTRLVRIHRADLDPLFFGKSGGNRFDDPQGHYGVCYLAMSREGAFAETCLRTSGARFVAFSFLEARCFCAVEALEPLHLAPLHGRSLARLGATGAVTSGPHLVAQRWSQALHDHGVAPDGILHRANHDDGEFSVALFERAKRKLRVESSVPITQDRAGLAGLLARYQVGLG